MADFRKIKQGLYSLVWSFILDFENEQNPAEENRQAVKYWEYIANEYCATSEEILSNAKNFLKIGLKHKDALHLSCAIKYKCDYLITTDKKFLNKNNKFSEIKIVNPITFILEAEENK